MLKSFLIRRKSLLIISTVILFLVSIFYGCQKTEYDNPHDSSVSASLWAPQNLTASQTSLKTAELKWIQTEQRIDSFCIESRKGNGEWKVIGYAGRIATSFIDNTFIPDSKTPVDYRIYAIAWQNKSFSGIKTVTPLFVRPNPPGAQRAPGVKIKVSWIDTYSNEDNYRVEKSVNGGNWILCADTISSNSSFYYDNNPELNTQIKYRLSAKAAGIWSDTTGTDKISTIIVPPTWFFVASLTQTSCRVDWKQGDDWTTGYKIDRQFGNNSWQDGWLTLDNTKTAFTDTNLPTDQDIKYRVSTIVNNSYSVSKEVFYGLAIPDTITTLNSTYTSIDLKSKVLEEGGSTVTEWGIVYGTSPNPTIADIKFPATTPVNVAYTATLSMLSNAITYYARTYAINRRGVSYGTQKVFKTAPFTVPVLDVTLNETISFYDASFSSHIIGNGGANVTEAGFVCSLLPNPTINDLKTLNTNTDPYFFLNYKLYGYFKNLTVGGSYYVRSYAINSAGIGYGPVKIVNLLQLTLPKIDYLSVEVVDANKVLISTTLTSNGGDLNLTRGFVWGSNINPTIADNKWTEPSPDNTSGSSFHKYILGLTENTTYHARAFAQNSKGLIYSPDQAFTTTGISMPTVWGVYIATRGPVSALVKCSVKTDGGLPILEAGIVYSTSINPTVNDNKVITNFTSPEYTLDCTLTPLTTGVIYHVRSFARNSMGLVYSGDYSFMCL